MTNKETYTLQDIRQLFRSALADIVQPVQEVKLQVAEALAATNNNLAIARELNADNAKHNLKQKAARAMRANMKK